MDLTTHASGYSSWLSPKTACVLPLSFLGSPNFLRFCFCFCLFCLKTFTSYLIFVALFSGTLPQKPCSVPTFLPFLAKVLCFSETSFLSQLILPALNTIWTQWCPCQECQTWKCPGTAQMLQLSTEGLMGQYVERSGVPPECLQNGCCHQKCCPGDYFQEKLKLFFFFGENLRFLQTLFSPKQTNFPKAQLWPKSHQFATPGLPLTDAWHIKSFGCRDLVQRLIWT